jgi:hypothetical protein
VTYRAYRQDNLSSKTLETIERINAILETAQADNVSMSLRQVYYKFVKNNWCPNSDREYKKIGTALDSGRMNGLISWTAIVDMNRALYGTNTQVAPEQLLEGLDNKFHLDLWADQQWRPEVWVEKLGMLNVIGDICSSLRVDYFACKGYNSQTEAWKAGQRMARYVRKGQRPIVFYAGDYDPSGLDMIRDVRERLETFTGVQVTVVPIALTMNQIEELGPDKCPPNPAKTTDSRSDGYVDMMVGLGYDEDNIPSWEVDALEPTYLRDLIRSNIDRLRDEERWSDALAREVAGKEWLRTMSRPERETDEGED